VIVPDVGEPALLAEQIRRVAALRDQEVLLIGVASQSVSEVELRRKLVLLSAFVREAGTKTEVRIERDLGWIPTFRPLLGDDDLLACCVDEGLPAASAEWIETLGRGFEHDIHAFMDSGRAASPRTTLAAQAAPWLCSLALIAGFTWLQVNLAGGGDDPVVTSLLILSMLAEVGSIWLCNALLG
jgi:hypothetical protein